MAALSLKGAFHSEDADVAVRSVTIVLLVASVGSRGDKVDKMSGKFC